MPSRPAQAVTSFCSHESSYQVAPNLAPEGLAWARAVAPTKGLQAQHKWRLAGLHHSLSQVPPCPAQVVTGDSEQPPLPLSLLPNGPKAGTAAADSACTTAPPKPRLGSLPFLRGSRPSTPSLNHTSAPPPMNPTGCPGWYEGPTKATSTPASPPYNSLCTVIRTHPHSQLP